MDDDYILMHGGTEEDIAQIAHGRGACNYAINGSYCEICKKGVKKMQLRNKKTGEIGWLETYYEKMIAVLDKKSEYHHYNSLSELNDEWEDYEEPKDKGYWYMDDLGRIQFSSEVLDELEDHPNNLMIRKLYGNYFETREEAEKAVEKLKAWKRLKDKGLKFKGISGYDEIHFWFPNPDDMFENSDTRKYLDLLFGGEE